MRNQSTMHGIWLLGSLVIPLTAAATLSAEEPESGFTAIFNGQNLAGWEGNLDLWSVEDGAITGRTTADQPIPHNTFLVWRGGRPANFELRLSYRIVGGNSGIQYRSQVADEKAFVVGGYQADIDSSPTYSGINYEERGRGILAPRGERVAIATDGQKTATKFGDAAELQKKIHPEAWNDYVVLAEGNHLRHYINGQLMSEVVDGQTEAAAKSGVLALQLHAGPPMKVQFRKIRLKELK